MPSQGRLQAARARSRDRQAARAAARLAEVSGERGARGGREGRRQAEFDQAAGERSREKRARRRRSGESVSGWGGEAEQGIPASRALPGKQRARSGGRSRQRAGSKPRASPHAQQAVEGEARAASGRPAYVSVPYPSKRVILSDGSSEVGRKEDRQPAGIAETASRPPLLAALWRRKDSRAIIVLSAAVMLIALCVGGFRLTRDFVAVASAGKWASSSKVWVTVARLPEVWQSQRATGSICEESASTAGPQPTSRGVGCLPCPQGALCARGRVQACPAPQVVNAAQASCTDSKDTIKLADALGVEGQYFIW